MIRHSKHPFAAACVWAAVLLLTAAPAAYASGLQHAEEEAGHGQAFAASEEEHSPEIKLSEAEQEEFGIVTAPAGPGIVRTTIELPGTIRPNDDRLAHLVPRYDGIVTAVHAHIGDQVKQGQALATIESDQSLAPYPLKTMIAGTVIEKHITLGEAASRDRAPFVVADLSTVWLDLHVYQRDMDRVRVGQKVIGCSGAEGGCLGRISYIAPVVDEITRTALARVVVENPEGRWRPGMFVTAEVEIGSSDVPVSVPVSAVFTMHGEPVVFTSDDHGFAPRHVEIGRTDGRIVEITAGLAAGEPVVVAGGFTLKAELEKAGFDDGHNH